MTDLVEQSNAIAIRDFEFSGSIARSAQQGAKFALMLAMLEQDVLKRPKVVSEIELKADEELNLLASLYRKYPLKAEDEHWQAANSAATLIHNQPIQDARLWLYMHPNPLSQFDDPTRIEPEVFANASYQTQVALKEPLHSNEIDVDETQIYELLEAMPDVLDVNQFTDD